jgi:Bacteriophage Gp15 protein
MFSLTSTFDDEFEYKGTVIRLNLAFDNVLRADQVFKDNMFYFWEQVDIALEILVDNYEDIKDFSFEDKLEIYKHILEEFLDIDYSKAQNGIIKKVFDFEKDAGLIYASFLSDYGIDLFEQQGKLHWKKFIQLLTYLRKDTVFKEVVDIRQKKVPPPNKYNREEREYILKMKRLYRLEDETEIIDEKQEVKEIDRKWDMVASALKRKAGER